MNLIYLIFIIKKKPILSWTSNNEFNFKPKFSTLFFLIFGLILFGLGEALLITANFGVSPWTVLAEGLSLKTNYSIGISTFIISIVVLIIWIPLKQKPGIGTILNTIIVSIIIDVSLPFLPSPELTTYKFIQVILGIAIVGLGSGFYLTANLGAGARDGLMIGFQKISNLSIVSIRSIIEISAIVIGFYLGGTVGIGTLLFAFGIGPFISASFIFLKRYIK